MVFLFFSNLGDVLTVSQFNYIIDGSVIADESLKDILIILTSCKWKPFIVCKCSVHHVTTVIK